LNFVENGSIASQLILFLEIQLLDIRGSRRKYFEGSEWATILSFQVAVRH
jgi:hypothetical protein